MQTGTTARQKLSVSNKKGKLKVLIVKSACLRNTGPVFLDLGLVQESYQSGPGCQDDGNQVVWKMDARRSGHFRWSA